VDKRSKTAREARLVTLLKAIDVQLTDVGTMVMHGKKYTPAELKALFQEELDAMANTRRATAARRMAVKAERRLTARNQLVLAAFESYLVAQHGADAPELETFTFKPHRKGKKTVEVKAKAAERAKETRKRLGTLGPKQRKKMIKGQG
jgi:hypothetical protein